MCRSLTQAVIVLAAGAAPDSIKAYPEAPIVSEVEVIAILIGKIHLHTLNESHHTAELGPYGGIAFGE